ncbi:hypothetical protein [Desulfovibrio cuneatus]|uniref:hypothetical protein n=1 Tax=Desulfovibrio cuneatus TaxID=159728 RepID=UPI000402B673|nr:hypothetical protein [Desulfovibrio cuneatus]
MKTQIEEIILSNAASAEASEYGAVFRAGQPAPTASLAGSMASVTPTEDVLYDPSVDTGVSMPEFVWEEVSSLAGGGESSRDILGWSGEYDDSLESLLQSPTYLLFEDLQGLPLAEDDNDPPAAVRVLPAMGDVLGGPGEEVPLMAVSPAMPSAGCVETGPVMLEETLVAHGFPVMLEQTSPSSESAEMTLFQFYSSTTMS